MAPLLDLRRPVLLMVINMWVEVEIVRQSI